MSRLIQQIDGVVGHTLDKEPELFLASPQRVLSLFALAQVAGDLGKAHQLTRRQTDGIDDHIRPEAGAVLAHAPALRFELAIADRSLKSPGRKLGFAVLLAIEDREMLPDN